MKWNKKVIDRVGELLQKKQSTLAVAESVTAGNLQVAFSLATNATLFFQGASLLTISGKNAGTFSLSQLMQLMLTAYQKKYQSKRRKRFAIYSVQIME